MIISIFNEAEAYSPCVYMQVYFFIALHNLPCGSFTMQRVSWTYAKGDGCSIVTILILAFIFDFQLTCVMLKNLPISFHAALSLR